MLAKSTEYWRRKGKCRNGRAEKSWTHGWTPNIDGGTLNFDGGTLFLDGGTRSPYNLSTAYIIAGIIVLLPVL